MENTLFNGDIEEPWERELENCKYKSDRFGIDWCEYLAMPCSSTLTSGKCHTLIEYFKGKMKEETNKFHYK